MISKILVPTDGSRTAHKTAMQTVKSPGTYCEEVMKGNLQAFNA